MTQRQFGCECSSPLMYFSPWCMMHDRHVFLSSCATHCQPSVWTFCIRLRVACRDADCVARFMPNDIAVAIWVILVLNPVSLIFSGLGAGAGWGSV